MRKIIELATRRSRVRIQSKAKLKLAPVNQASNWKNILTNITHNWLLIKSYKNHFLISVIISLVLDIATRRFQVRIQGKQNQNWLLRLNQDSDQKIVLTNIDQLFIANVIINFKELIITSLVLDLATGKSRVRIQGRQN